VRTIPWCPRHRAALDPRGEFEIGHAFAKYAKSALQHFVGQRRGRPDALELVRRFHRAHEPDRR